ncbi:hypothetical protein [Candidatus Nitrosocosmicus sp. SS]|jgi:hypothetical protein|uniref:hypothetical protein n=1 Tax=Candidatus Nitrosocosmicus agrestis TaxID=2563600 RepID=UPI00122E69D5|nr:hypothetical protein [Candidatus Nitrosocosmicus sp. SS]KAA2283723.1 hypothetical protein F1Z66_00065 [Candidatus Nitrosocosmicus sp. SS]KAF0870100.1 hypothetical protein E5N71_00790 [Candidatus Nitrosocosmicus sp. SS]
MTVIPEQFNEGYSKGRSDARIINREGKVNRWINMNDINHKHDDWIYGYCKGFADQREKIEMDRLSESRQVKEI